MTRLTIAEADAWEAAIAAAGPFPKAERAAMIWKMMEAARAR